MSKPDRTNDLGQSVGPENELLEQAETPEPAPQTSEPISAGWLPVLPVLVLTIFVIDLPIVFYGLLYDRYPHLVTGLLYIGYSLFLAYGASKMCEETLRKESLRPIFGLQVLLCLLPGLMIGSYLASPYLKATLLPPISVRSLRVKPQPLFSGYYKFRSVVVRGHLTGSDSDVATGIATTYQVAPLTAANWRQNGPVLFWIVCKEQDDSFSSGSVNYGGFGALLARTTPALTRAAENAAELHGLKIARDPIFVTQLSEPDVSLYGRYLALSLVVLDAFVLWAIVAVHKRRERNRACQ